MVGGILPMTAAWEKRKEIEILPKGRKEVEILQNSGNSLCYAMFCLLTGMRLVFDVFRILADFDAQPIDTQPIDAQIKSANPKIQQTVWCLGARKLQGRPRSNQPQHLSLSRGPGLCP